MNEETKRKLIEAYIAGGELLDMFDEIDRIEEEAKRLYCNSFTRESAFTRAEFIPSTGSNW